MKIVFHIGYHKTGTSWLQQILFSSHERIHLISNYNQPWLDPLLRYLIHTPDRKFNISTCRSLLEKKINNESFDVIEDIILVSAERLSGHPFSGNYDDFKIARRIFECWPSAKILCVIRNQVDIIESLYRQMVREGYPGKIDYFLNFKYWKGVGFDISTYEYDLLILHYQKLFGFDKVAVLTYETMYSNIEKYVEKIFHFLGIHPISIKPELLFKKINRSMSTSGLYFLRFINNFRSSELNPFPVLKIFRPLDNSKSLYIGRKSKIYPFIYNMINSLPGNRKILNTKVRDKLKNYYKGSNRRLVQLLKNDSDSINEVLKY